MLEQVRACLSRGEFLSIASLSVSGNIPPERHGIACFAGPLAKVANSYSLQEELITSRPPLYTLNLPSLFGTGGSGGLSSSS